MRIWTEECTEMWFLKRGQPLTRMVCHSIVFTMHRLYYSTACIEDTQCCTISGSDTVYTSWAICMQSK